MEIKQFASHPKSCSSLSSAARQSLTLFFLLAKNYLFYRHFFQTYMLKYKNPCDQQLPLWGSWNKKAKSQLPVLDFAKEGRLRGSNHSFSPRFHIFNVKKLNLYPSIASFHTQNIPTRHGIWICVICEIDLQLVLALTGPFVWFQRSSDITKGRRIVSASAELVVQSRLGFDAKGEFLRMKEVKGDNEDHNRVPDRKI